jgi:lipoyl(octanoyl) transferase
LTHTEEKHRILVVRLGRTRYRACWDLQRELQIRRAAHEIDDVLLLTEHDPVITLGTTANEMHLLASTSTLNREGIDVVTTDRGGDITFHGPGQLVGYPILDLTRHKPDLHWYLRQLEATVIAAAGTWGVRASRINGYTGVWAGNEKICAIGINVRRWVTCHGFALNLNTELSCFRHIIPCGIFDLGVTSISALIGHAVELQTAEDEIVRAWERVFNQTVYETTCRELGLDSKSFERCVA